LNQLFNRRRGEWKWRVHFTISPRRPRGDRALVNRPRAGMTCRTPPRGFSTSPADALGLGENAPCVALPCRWAGRTGAIRLRQIACWVPPTPGRLRLLPLEAVPGTSDRERPRGGTTEPIVRGRLRSASTNSCGKQEVARSDRLTLAAPLTPSARSVSYPLAISSRTRREARNTGPPR
jgi:hypothetical protein